eukprot:TRINITY_DN2833_c0_g2_i4.p1 TRINITY_DN2833_c0_g2~~TRINITY_DN2833_c0_g2_i4.p1  ORF type:complete len:242 (-),score=57.89 TRINITY_DN2833_c0_g2_i4:102-827(-)
MSHSKVLIVEQAVTKTVVAPSPPKSQSTGMPLKLMLSLVRDNPSLILYFYSHLLQTKPIKTKAISAAIINIIGNIINQTVFEKKLRGGGALDLYRVGSFGLYAAILSYFIHKWYLFLDSKQLTKSNIYVRVFIDQLLFSPCITAFFFAFMELMELVKEEGEHFLFGGRRANNKSLVKRIESKLKQSFVPTQKMCWRVWPLAQLFNFKFVEPQYRVLFGNLVGCCWGIYLSYISNKSRRGGR